jgi:thioredoxin reductase
MLVDGYARNLGGPGGTVPGWTHEKGLPAHKGKRPGQEHVKLPPRTGHGRRERRATYQHRGPRIHGGDRLEGTVVEDNRSGVRRNLGVRALFAFIGADANTSWLEGAVDLDERGFVLTGKALDGPALDEDAWRERSREPFLQETSLPGVFAAGDVRSGSIKRCTSAVGEGAMAVSLVHQYLAEAGV